MKRLVFLCGLLAVLAASAYYLGTGLKKKASPEEVIPPSANLVLAWDNPVAAYRSFLDTPLGSRLQAIDWAGALADLEPEQTIFTTILEQFSHLNRLATSSLAREFFSQRVVVALLPVEENRTGSRSIRKQFVVVTEPAHPARMFDVLETVGATGSGIALEQYQGRIIRKYPLAHKLALYVTRIDGLLLASLDPAPLKRCLDEDLARLTRSRTGLALNSGYMDLVNRGDPVQDVFFYADASGIATLATAALMTVSNRQMDVGALRNFLAPLEFGGLFLDRGQEVRRLTTVLRLDPVRLSSLQQKLLARSPVINRKTSVMPADLVVYFWSNWLDLPAWWSKVPGPRGRDIEAAVLEYTGLPMNAFLSLFGEEFGFNVTEIRTSGFVPVPRICLCIEVQDHQRLARMLNARLKDLPLQREKVTGGEIVSLMAAGGLMQPAYALLKKFLIVADGRDQIDAILPATGNQASRSTRLADDPDFIQVDVGMMKPANVIFFARISRLVPGLKEFASWGSILLSIWDKEAARKSQILVDRIVQPLLDGLSMFRALALRGTVQGRDLVLQAALSRKRSRMDDSDHR
ncbi:hypothetical protein [Desulfolithobacter sp.]